LERGWIKLYRKSKDSSVFLHDGLWKLWCLCLMKANHKEQHVSMEGLVKPVLVRPGQFITGRFQLHGAYHQWRRGYKKKRPAPSTAWRWLEKLQEMQMLRIKSFSKYSIITIANWGEYQQNEQQVNNRRTTGEHKQECIKNEKEGRAYQRFKENL